MAKLSSELIVYQTKNGALELRVDSSKQTFKLTQQQVADIFDVQKSAISKHVKNIFKCGELSKKATVSILETVQVEGKRKVKRAIELYDLDLVLSIGYRVNSVKATKFRKWSTSVLKDYMINGYAINKKHIASNYTNFQNAVENVRKLLPVSTLLDAHSAIELIKMFADTWLNLDAYDKSNLPKAGITRKQVEVTAKELSSAISQLKDNLIQKNEATDFFAKERSSNAIEAILGNIFQSFGGEDLYPSLEEKAAHLLYFVIKNHPFVDGNKRSGAFSFIWFLNKVGLLNTSKLTSEALTALTLLIAESNPINKEQMIGLILLLLGK